MAYKWVVWLLAVELFVSILDISKANIQLPHSKSHSRENALGIIFEAAIYSLIPSIENTDTLLHHIVQSPDLPPYRRIQRVLRFSLDCWQYKASRNGQIVKDHEIKEHYSLLKLL